MAYKKIQKADQKNTEGGYKNVVNFCKVTDFLTTAKPAVAGSRSITADHTFGAGKGFTSWLCTKHSVTTTAETTGDVSKSLIHKAKFSLLGDSSSTLEQVEEMLNDENIFMLKDQDCLNATEFIQFGDECSTPDVSVSFDGKTTKEGMKEYTVELSVKGKKFFYSGALTQAA
jgi:hypothetical protein